MTKWIAALTFLACACPAFAQDFSTTFDQSENPISQGGVWAHNASNAWQKIRTSGGNALAAGYTEIYDDAYAYLANWVGDDYEVIATVLYAGISAGEVEILLRVTDGPFSIRCYEFLFNVAGGWQLVRWNGPLGDFVVIHQGGGVPQGIDGAQIRATIVGPDISLYWRAKPGDGWTTLLSDFQDPGGSGSPVTSGKPGMAFYVHAAANNINNIGFKDYSVRPLGGTRVEGAAAEAGHDLDLMLLPNPLQSNFIVNLPANAGPGRLSLYGVSGQLVRTFPVNGSQGAMAVRRLKSGVYLLKVDTRNLKAVRRLVVL